MSFQLEVDHKTGAAPNTLKSGHTKLCSVNMSRLSILAIALLLVLLAASAQAQFFVRLGDKKKGGATTGDVAPKTDTPPADAPAPDGGDSGSAIQTESGETAVQSESDGGDVDVLWKAFVRWFRENGGIISSKLELKERNGRRGVYFKERMRRGETIVSFPRTLRMEEKSAMKSKGANIFKELKQAEVFPDLRMVLYLIYEKHNPDSFWKPYIQVQLIALSPPLFAALSLFLLSDPLLRFCPLTTTTSCP
jgi:hypothetical protein